MDKEDAILMIVLNADGKDVPSVTITKSRFIKYEMLEEMRIYVQRKNQEIFHDFEIEPNNKHMLVVKNW